MSTGVSEAALRDLVLGVLARRDACGLDVAAAVAGDPETTGASIPEGSIYPALRWIERHGLASGHY